MPSIPALPSEDITFSLSENTRYSFGLTLEQPVFTWGRIQNSIDAAALGSQAGILAQSLAARNLHTVVDSCLASLALIEKIRTLLADQELKARRLMVLSEESYAAGFILNTELLEARLLAAEVSLADYESREQASATILTLRNLTGIAGLELGQVELPPSLAAFFGEEEGPGPEATYTGGGRDELRAMLYRNNVSLRILELQARAQERLLEAARGRSLGKPELGLFAELEYSGPRFPFVEGGWDTENRVNLTASLGIRTLLFDGGAMQSGIRQKEEAAIQARLELERGRRGLEEYLESTLLGLDVSRRRQEYLSLKAAAERARGDQAENAWNAGYGAERDYLTHELIWYTNRIELCKEKLSALLAVLQLEHILEIDHVWE
jgi:outer membrane protein TolC